MKKEDEEFLDGLDKIFEYYVYAVLVWVHLALAFEIYIIFKEII